MEVSIWVWAIVLVAQNASFTWVSRARNSGSDWYHAIASVFSNGIWFAAFYFTFDYLDRIHATNDPVFLVTITVVYIASTVTGSVVGGKILRKFFEKGKRQVGHYDAKAEQLAGLVKRVGLLETDMGRVLTAPSWRAVIDPKTGNYREEGK